MDNPDKWLEKFLAALKASEQAAAAQREADRKAQAEREAARDEREAKREAKREAAEAKREAERKAERKAEREADRKAAAVREAAAAERIAAIERLIEANRKDIAANSKSIKETNRNVSGEGNRRGEVTELEFYGRIKEDGCVGVISVDGVEWRARHKNYEFDIVCENGSAVLVGEIKYNLRRRDVIAFARDRLPLFAGLFPHMVKGGKAVLGFVGGARVSEEAAEEAKKRGLIVLRLKNRELVAENDKDAQPVPPAE